VKQVPILGAYGVDIKVGRCFSQREPGKCATCVTICPHNVLTVDEMGRIYAANEQACVGCRLCVEYCPQNAIMVRATATEPLIRGLWRAQSVEEIRYKAQTGKYLLRGFGALKPLPHFDDFLIIPAQLSPPAPLDKYREKCDIKVVIGEGRVKRPVVMEIPIMISAMSYGAISKEAKIATEIAAANTGTLIGSGEGGSFSGEELIVHGYRNEEDLKKGVKAHGPGGYFAVQWSTGRWGVNLDYLLKADVVEVKIGQGAKPGMGGHLLGEKVKGEIAEIRGLPEGTAALSPARHLDVLDVKEHLKQMVETLKDITDYEKPIIVKLGPGRVYEDVRLAAEAGADAVAIDGKYGGTGASPEPTTQHAGLPTIACISPAVKALKDLGLYGDVKLMVMGGVMSGADAVKAIAMGADAVAMSSAIMVAMGCHTCFSCHTGKCPMGIATQDPELRARLNPEIAAKGATNFLKATTEEIKMLTMLAGHSSIKELSKEDLRALTSDVAAITGVKLAGS